MTYNSGVVLFYRHLLFHKNVTRRHSLNYLFTCGNFAKRLISNNLNNEIISKSISRPMKEESKWKPTEVRKLFLEYFVDSHSHVLVPSSSVIPHNDSTLLYTNSGMNQFKPIFLGQVDSTSHFGRLKRATNYQKCVRVGGKHNDFDDVGKDGYHHTFFEMLGNWSFGDYFKADACKMAFQLLTAVYGLSKESIYVTYFGGDASLGLPPDEECRDIWIQLGMPNDHILPFGLKENFWVMADTGPCGPCSEIHYSHLGGSNEARLLVNAGSPEVIEIWNLVFMQFNRTLNGNLEVLPKCHVDTGMGFERLVAVLQNSHSTYDTELFQPLFTAIEKEVGCPPYGRRYQSSDETGADMAYRIIADHARMSTICLSDGVLPSNIDAGHCLRRAIRRGIMASSRLTNDKSLHRGLLGSLIPRVVDTLGEAYPELQVNLAKVIEAIREEEDRFLLSIGKGFAHFQASTSHTLNSSLTFSAELMWRLYSYFGIPEDMIVDLAISRGLVSELDKFHQIMNTEKLKNRQIYLANLVASKQEKFDPSALRSLLDSNVPLTDDCHKYEYHFDEAGKLTVPKVFSEVVGLWNGEQFVENLGPSDAHVSMVTRETNFYAEAGGQMSDIGSIVAKQDQRESNQGRFQVDCVSCISGYVLHHGTLFDGQICCGDAVELSVNEVALFIRIWLACDYDIIHEMAQTHREGCTRNHTATHLLNAALVKVLSETEQRSSHVTADHLRFDFTTKVQLTKEQLLKVEEFVQDAIQKKCPVVRTCVPLEFARSLPQLRMIPGEVYPDTVSVITIADDPSDGGDKSAPIVSREACCGTHLRSTDPIRKFVITTQKPQGQTVRSVRALTGPQALFAVEFGNRLSVDVQTLAVKVEDFVRRSEEGKADNLAGIYRKLARLRLDVSEADISVIIRNDLDLKIEGLQRKVTKMMRAQMSHEFDELLAQNQELKYIVHFVKSAVDREIVFIEMSKRLPKIPTMVFTVQDKFVHGRCVVPKAYAQPNFNAETWIKQSLSQVESAALKPYKKNPEIDCTFSFSVDQSNLLSHIIQVADELASEFR